MKITYLPDINRLRVDEPTVSAGSGLYTSVEAAVTLNCGAELVEEYDTVQILDTVNSKFYLLPTELDSLYFKPEMFGLTTFIDGIYYIRLNLWKPAGGYTQMANCAFVDVTFKCKVAQLLEGVISSGLNTMAHMLHYSLTNGSNCGCNCDELCVNFALLGEILTESPQIRNDCGCN